MKDFIKDHKFNLLVLLLLFFATYANALDNAFLSDDLAEIVKNPRVGDFSYIFTHPFGFIRILLNFFVFHLAGLNQIVFRLINYFFHFGNIFLIYYLLNSFYSKKVALFAAALFAIHPLLTEPIIWISGGTYPQYAFFFLLAFVFYLKNSKRYFFLSIFSYFLAFNSHPVMPAALFLVFPIYELTFGNFKKNWLKALPYLLITLTYIFINFSVLPEREATLQTVHYQEKGIDNPFVQIPIAISSYTELILFPKTLTLYHSEMSYSSVEFILRILVTIIILLIIPFSFKKNKSLFFWGSFALLALAPTLTPFRFNWIVAERYFYLPSIGVFTLAGLALSKLIENKKIKNIIIGLFIIILIALCIRTIMRNIDWHNEDNLWIATGKTSPSSPNTHNNLGDVYGRHGNKEAAAKEFMTAIALKPNYADAYHNLGNTYLEMGKPDEALQSYFKAAEINPNLWQSYQNISSIYFQAKQFDKAIEFMQKAIQINPQNLGLYNNLGIIYFASGDKNKAKEVFSFVLQNDPQNQIASQGFAEASKP